MSGEIFCCTGRQLTVDQNRGSLNRLKVLYVLIVVLPVMLSGETDGTRTGPTDVLVGVNRIRGSFFAFVFVPVTSDTITLESNRLGVDKNPNGLKMSGN